MCSEHIQGDERGTYVALIRAAPPERGMPYRARAPWVRSHRSSRGWGEPIAWRRVAGGRQMNRGRVRDAHRPEPKCLSSTGELIDIERVTISLEGGRWKSTRWGNSLAAYPTASTVRGGGHATPEKVNGPYSTQRRVGGGPGSFSTPADRSVSQKLSTPVRRCPRLCCSPSRRLGRRPQPSQWPGGCRSDAEGTRPARSYPGPPWGFSTPRSSDAPLRTASA
jgi:hypothetical protein